MGNPYLLNPEWSTLRKLLVLQGGAPLNEYEIEGNPVAFNTNVAKPLSGFTIPFLPVQSGTGDPSPENIRPITGWTGLTAYRTGKNLLIGIETGEINRTTGEEESGSSTTRRNVGFVPVEPGQTYTLGTFASAGDIRFFEYGSDKAYLGNTIHVSVLNATHTVGANTHFIRFQGSKDRFGGADIQLEKGAIHTQYEAYQGNSYPVVFPAQGKNLFDLNESKRDWYVSGGGTAQNGWTVSNGVITTGEGCNGGYIVPCTPGQAYTYSFTTSYGGGTRLSMRAYFFADYPGKIDSQTPNEAKDYNGTPMTFTAPDWANWMVIGFFANNAISGTTIEEIMLNAGETALPYEPFTNTIYGGTAFPLEGRALVEYVLWTKNTASMNNAQNYPGWMNAGIRNLLGAEVDRNFYNQIINIGKVFGVNTKFTNDILFLPKTSYQLTQDEWIALALDVQFAIPLATPIEIPIDPITVQTLIGDNTIWTDTNGENAVKYLKKG